MKRKEIQSILEALLFVADEPVSAQELAEALPEELRSQVPDRLEELEESYKEDGRGLQLVRVAGGWRLQTRPDLYPWVSGFLQVTRRQRLSRAALETLAVVTYRQPLTAPEIGEVRGVDPSSAIKTLLDKGLIRITGRKDVVGKPFLYGTTRLFLEEFGLDSLDDLPDLEEFEGLIEDRLLSEAQQELFEGEASAEEDGEEGNGEETSGETVTEDVAPAREAGDSTETEDEENTNTRDAGRAEHEQGRDEQRGTEARAQATEAAEGGEETGQEAALGEEAATGASPGGGETPEDHRRGGDHESA